MHAAKLAGPATLFASGALLFVALFFGDGTSGGRLFWIGALAVLAAAVSLGAGPIPVPRGPGLACFALIGALTAWVGLTMWWSIAPDRSWQAFDRTLVYGAFAVLGLLATRVPRPARTVAGGLAVLIGLVLLWALAGKVVPSLVPDGFRVARLRNPIGYWNSLALVAATAVPLGLWLSASRRHHAAVRAVGAVLVYLAEVAAVLTLSRAGILVAGLAALAWLAIERDRLETARRARRRNARGGTRCDLGALAPCDHRRPPALRRPGSTTARGSESSSRSAPRSSSRPPTPRHGSSVPEERRRAYALRAGAVLAVGARRRTRRRSRCTAEARFSTSSAARTARR